jgi:hypothetical protein
MLDYGPLKESVARLNVYAMHGKESSLESFEGLKIDRFLPGRPMRPSISSGDTQNDISIGPCRPQPIEAGHKYNLKYPLKMLHRSPIMNRSFDEL